MSSEFKNKQTKVKFILQLCKICKKESCQVFSMGRVKVILSFVELEFSFIYPKSIFSRLDMSRERDEYEGRVLDYVDIVVLC